LVKFTNYLLCTASVTFTVQKVVKYVKSVHELGEKKTKNKM